MLHMSFADLSDKSSAITNKNIRTEIQHHPAGPVVRKIWTDPISDLPYKIEIHSLRSGGFLLNGAKLVQENATGIWYLESENSKVQLLSKGQSKKKVIWLLDGCKWEVNIIFEHLPKPIFGIATEDEPYLDLLLIKVTCS